MTVFLQEVKGKTQFARIMHKSALIERVKKSVIDAAEAGNFTALVYSGENEYLAEAVVAWAKEQGFKTTCVGSVVKEVRLSWYDD